MPEDVVSTLIPIVMIGLISLGIGGIAGFLLAGLQTPASKAEPKRGRSLVETARLWRDRRSGKILVESNGQMYQAVDELSPDQRIEFNALMDELQNWLGVPDLAGRITVPPVRAPAASSPVSEAIGTQFAPSVPQPVLPSAPLIVDVPPETKSPSLQVGDILARAVNLDTSKKETAPPKSIAGQVDEIVQEWLPGSLLSNRTIKLMELPGKGLVVFVDGTEYEGIGDVADPAVQTFLRGCVAEWERRTEIKK